MGKAQPRQLSNIPTILTIFGVTGDLTAKKIIPSLWHLFLRGLLPDRLSVIGFARRPLSGAEFEKLVRDAVAKYGGAEIKEENFSRFFSFFSFFLHEKEMKVQYVEEYSKILYASMRGEQTFFVSPEEIEAAWKFTDSIIGGWKRNLIPLKEYEPGAAPLWAALQSAPDFPPPAMESRASEELLSPD